MTPPNLPTMKMKYRDPAQDKDAWARELGISREAIDIYLGSDVLDLHVETYIWQRIFGYDMRKRHGQGPFGARLFGQVDLARVREAHITGAPWSISTNPLRGAESRAQTAVKNVARLKAILESVPDDVVVCKTLADYRAARAQGKHGAFLGIQGGNALDKDLAALDLIDDTVLRVTVVHLYNSRLGVTSAPSRKSSSGLTALGKDYVQKLNAKRIFVDLAHIHRDGFFDALSVHDRSQPVIVTHTGVKAVCDSWRNLDDEQIKAVADTGGTMGVIYQMPFIGGESVQNIVDHMAHILQVAGEDFVSLGSDWDGMILPPRDMPTCLELPRMVQVMLDRRWSAERIGKILGGNFLRTVGHLRPTTPDYAQSAAHAAG
ncbi:MAG: membrane dipeptidase [Deltaproteobacteria bacterium]|nr:membrane dipeptidase [Deltaproteobacteria bacterium]